MSSTFYKIKWKSSNPLKDNINFENFNHTYELCIEFVPKQLTEKDCLISKYYPTHLIKYPININKESLIKDGYIIIKSDEFKQLLIKNDIQQFYITKTTYDTNDTNDSINIKKIKIQSNCSYNNCQILNDLPSYKKLYLNINTNCSGDNCNFATLSIKKKNNI
jgi:hypothetical protein